MDFNKKQDRIKYLEDKFDNLMDVIGETYGSSLMEELVSRLNNTIEDFNKEMSSLFDLLKEKEKERQKYLNDIPDKKTTTKKEAKLTKWEKKLKKIEKSK